ncbi:hypothetical protein BH24ACT5_BH24ACT5_27410 [soil metagenome]
MRERRRTSTSNFGAGARESHDATRFYQRFRAPELSSDSAVAPPVPVAEPFVCGDARRLHTVADASVALVVTSPPYFAGKQYEEELERDGIPSSYLEFLDMLTDVFAECQRVLEPGGRIAVNVANLGRKPYRSLSADVIGILERDLGMLLRGEIIWQKAEGAGWSCAWGTFRSARNPLLRDVTERVIVASKGRFDRARTAAQRAADGLPHESTMLTEDFLAATLDVWSIPPESATRIGHPAPFPTELPEQLIQLYTFVDDLVLDPFMGSGSTLVAAARLGRRYVGYDLDPDYVALAQERMHHESAPPSLFDPSPIAAAAAVTAGKTATDIAAEALAAAWFTDVRPKRRVRGTGVTVDFAAQDLTGGRWHVLVGGPHVAHGGGLLRLDRVWRTLGRAAALRGSEPDVPVLVVTTHPPRPSSDGDNAVRSATGEGQLVVDVVDILSAAGADRLAHYARSGPTPRR